MPITRLNVCIKLCEADKAKLQEKAIGRGVSVSELVRQWVRADGN